MKTNWKQPSGSRRQLGLGFARDLCRVIVENDLDRGRRRVGGVEPAEEFDEFAAAMAIPHQGVHLARQQIDARHQAHCSMPLVLVIAADRRMAAGHRQPVGRRGSDRLDGGFSS